MNQKGISEHAEQRVRWALYAFLVRGLVTLIVVSLFLPHVSLAETITGRVVGQNGEGVPQAVVFLLTPETQGTMVPHPQPAIMDQVHKAFIPAVLPVSVGTEVRFPNNDQIHHHVYSFSRAKSFELPLYKGETAPPVVFDKPGVVKIGCNIHDWMSAVILVVPSSFYAMTDPEGNFTLADVPSGTYSLACWHERSQAKAEETAQNIEVAARPVTVNFSLSLSPPRPRNALTGARGVQ